MNIETKKEFKKVYAMLDKILISINNFSASADLRFEQIERRLNKLESQMTHVVTKSYLDEKLATFAERNALKIREDQVGYQESPKLKKLKK
ncbi:MAG: hypothetical protein JWO40_35 [Candidatus Doudnabacteria bacterium]|nr:hypothetical protein [Candidatus Doudnabacteria bacterium]